ncbi:OmpP1/FadL family transporter [Maribacter algicola]|uniref:OmpP1/FadL family transporter n=1 Tax=Meishania litoralis TaxID=3434685 RepID=A0ACC7LEZ0_9FLAO
MKRYITFIMLSACALVSAQNINDVMRYGSENLQGTARFQGLSGAFGALGGDLSALNVNPAGSAVFNNSLFTVSGTSYTRDNAVRYFNGNEGTISSNVDLNQIGGVMVFKTTDPDADWKKVSLAINYDVVQDLDDSFFVSGNSDQGIDNYFLNFANGKIPLQILQRPEDELTENYYLDLGANSGFGAQQAYLGFQGFLFEPVDDQNPDNVEYISSALYDNVFQEFSRTTAGYNGKFTLNAATQFKNRLHLGASLNFHNIQYTQLDNFYEDGYNTDSEIQFTTFDNYLQTQGSAFSFSLGTIMKLNEFFRIGGSYQSPTWYRLTDDFSQRLNSNIAQEERSNGNSDIHFINFEVVNLFEAYTIKIPEKLTGSLAIIFGKNGLLSLDYSYQDMARAELRPETDSSFNVINNQIANELGAVSSVRVGGEYRIAQISLRGGFRYEQSPYINETTIGDLSGFSAGIGYNFGGSRLDLAFNRSEQDINKQLFDTGLTTRALINNINTNVTLGYTLNF